MKFSRLRLFLLLLVSGLAVLPAAGTAQDQAKKKPPPAQEQQPEEEYTEEEYDAYDKAVKEPDLDKRAVALFAYMEKYPKSKLQPYIVTSYQTLMYDYQQKQDYAKLGPLAEQWLKYFPNDLATYGYIAEAAQKRGDDKKFLEYGLKVYAAKPTGALAYFLAQSYKKTGDKAKYLEWTEKCFPYYPENFELRMEFVSKYTEEKNYAKASEYANLVLKSIQGAKKPDATAEAVWRDALVKTKRSCQYIIALDHYDKDRFKEAIAAFEETLRIDPKFDWAYYYIGLSQWRLGMVENHEAPLSFAKAYTLKGEAAGQAKEHLEKIYKAGHNGNLTGVEKIYLRAEKEMAEKSAGK